MKLIARVEDGWLVVPCASPTPGHVAIGIGQQQPEVWTDAFIDRTQGVVKIRPALAGPQRVWLRTNGTIQEAGTVRI